jgi:glycosyltransferase involved in cell wall biosynthesis
VIPTLKNAGAETILARLIKEFHESGIKQYVLVIKGDESDYFYPKLKEICPVLLWTKEKQKAIQLIKKQAPTASFLAWMYGGIFFAYRLQIRYRLNAKIIWNIRQSNFRSNQIRQKILLFVFGLWSQWVTPKIIYCAYAAQKTHQNFLFSKKSNVVIQNRLAKEIDDRTLDILKLPEHFILFVGRHDPVKGIDRLFRVTTQFFSEFPKYKLVIAGSGWNNHLIPKKITDSVILLGNVPYVNQLYQKAECYTFTSYFEGFPNVLVEAVCNGCPVVAFPAGDSTSIIENYNYGHLVASEKQFLNQLTQIIQQHPKKEERAKEANRQKQRFLFKNTVEEYKDFIFEK